MIHISIQKAGEEGGSTPAVYTLEDLKAAVSLFFEVLKSKFTLESTILYGVIFMGVVFCGTGFFLFQKQQRIVASGVPVQGRVVELVETVDSGGHMPSKGSKPRKLFAPRFAYQWNGGDYTHLSNHKSTRVIYPLDSTVEMFINPRNPGELLVNDFSHRWLLPVVFSLVGGVVIGAGFLFKILFRACFEK